MKLENLSLDELYDMKAKVGFAIHLKKHNAKPVPDSLLPTLHCVWNFSRHLELDYGFNFTLHEDKIHVDARIIDNKPVFYLIRNDKPLFFNDSIKYWSFSESGIISALNALRGLYESKAVA